MSSEDSAVVVVPGDIPEDMELGSPIGDGSGAVYTWDNINVYTATPPTGYVTDMNTAAGNTLKQSIKAGCCKGGKNFSHVLKNVSGVIRPGQLLALMGSSGAGKTTLLNVLHFNSGKLHVEGDRCINGTPVDATYATSLSGYVQQEDLFIPQLTVREHLVFTARVKMDAKVSFADRMQRVDQCIHDLGLTKCQNTKIGDPAKSKGISGGEMKRLAFASEYITDPLILLCDEPTSGLDAFMAQSVVEVMQKMAQQGKSIICTIHQPASEVFEMFDHICLLSAGRVAFAGTTAETLAFFDETGYPCPMNYNPADFFIFTLAIDPADEENCKTRSDAICSAYAKSTRHDEIETIVKFRKPHIHHGHSHHGSKLGLCNSPYRVGWCTQFEALLHRTFITTIREPLVFVARFVQIMATASLLALVFYQQPVNQSGLKNINATIFMIMLFMTVVNTFGVIFVFCGEIPIFLREHWNGMYRTDAYFLSKTLVELPFMVVYALLFDAFVYYAVGLLPGWRNFMWCCIITVMVANAAASFGYFISTICKDLVVAFAITPPLLVPIFLFSGFFIRDEVTPWFWKWAKYCTWFYYGCETLFVNQWMEILDIDNEKNETLFLSDGEQVLMFFGFDYRNFDFDIYALGCLILVIRGIAYVSLLMKAYNRK